MFRHSCGECHYTNLRRTADITLADFWGWEKIDNEINKDDKGVVPRCEIIRFHHVLQNLDNVSIESKREAYVNCWVEMVLEKTVLLRQRRRRMGMRR